MSVLSTTSQNTWACPEVLDGSQVLLRQNPFATIRLAPATAAAVYPARLPQFELLASGFIAIGC